MELNRIADILQRLNPNLDGHFVMCLTVQLATNSIGLLNTIKIFEFGYPLQFTTMSAFNVISAWKTGRSISPASILNNVLFSLHGINLTTFLLYRTYLPKFKECFNQYVISENSLYESIANSNFLQKLVLWIVCSAFYSYSNIIPYLFTLKGNFSHWTSIAGVSLFLFGAVFQAVADYQKTDHKNKNGPLSLCQTGLYRLCRHPNYLGEVLMQIGVFLTGYKLFPSFSKFLIAGFPQLLMCGVMIHSTNIMTDLQSKKYANKEFRDYASNTKKLIPFIW